MSTGICLGTSHFYVQERFGARESLESYAQKVLS